MTDTDLDLSPRTRIRQSITQYLYAIEVQDERDLPLSDYLPSDASSSNIEFAEKLVDCLLDHQSEIDELISTHADNWDFERIALIDRNLLRLGIAEMKYYGETPTPVVINECVELAKTMGSKKSHEFVNAILDNIPSQ